MPISIYDDHIEELENQVARNAKLRDSQVPDSAQFDHYQREASQLAKEAIRLKRLVPSLLDLDEKIDEAEERATRARFKEDRELDLIWGLIFGGSILTVLALLIIVVWNPAVWLTIATVVLFAGTVALVLYGLKRRVELATAREEAVAGLAQLVARRDALLNGESEQQSALALQAVS